MNQKDAVLKMVFGLIIFMFALALAYFTANYLNSNTLFDYWLTLASAAALYTIIGILVSMIYPVSLGFLFAADVLILNVLDEKYSLIDSAYKAAFLLLIIVILYVASWRAAMNKNEPALNVPLYN